ncbi:DNA recombination protein RmuC [Thalassospira marina]|uniref:DNA recombination protein RmuC homolog n=1 Tax=Thalassospira marina TaxID=2048283 RepID=A0A2N3KSU7_9PROT|nr:DNA recombination protein RmuC [Thalassospira marina]AUG51322.1 DNA recombination protein RmuC [Thalassospira marina]PKR53621.1 DNA recombination protein RmuC [Thalassospira marina]
MDPVSLAVGGIVVLVVSLVFSTQLVKRARESALAEAESHNALIAAQLEQAEATRRELASELAQLRDRFDGVAEKRAIAETTANRVPGLETEIRELRVSLEHWREKGAELETALEKEREAAQEKLQMLDDARVKLLDSFKALSSDALKVNNDEFMKMARESFSRLQEGAKGDLEKRQQAIDGLVKPIRERLEAFDVKVNELENSRKLAYGELREQVGSLVASQQRLSRETQTLSSALRSSSSVSGKWGELQLKRIVELAGMVNHCDFEEQVHFKTDEGDQKPDMVIHLPGGKNIVVDAKAPTSAYLEAIEEKYDDDRREALMGTYVANVRKVIAGLSKKSYWKSVNSPEFVVLFLPGESFFSSALERDPSLIEDSFRDGVILATPTTLLGLLKAVAYGWRQEALADNARDISEIGQQLFDRLGSLAKNFTAMGKSLEGTVKHYNKTLGSLESSVLVSAKRLKEKHIVADDRDIDQPGQSETHVRQLSKPELTAHMLEDRS